MATLTVNATLGNDSVSNAQLENMAQGTLKGRAAGGGAGDPQDLTADQVSTILDAATDPFVRTSDQLETSTGGNGAADAGKVLEFRSEGQIQASVENSTTAAVRGISTGTGYAGHFSAASALEALLAFNFGSGPAALLRNGSTGLGADIEAAGKALSVHAAYTGVGSPDIADFETGLVPAVKLRVKFDGGLEWPSAGTGPQTTATNLPTFGSSTKGVVPASGGGTTNFLRADGSWAAPPSGGITDGSTLSIGLEFPQAGLKIYDQNADHTLVIVPDENFTADRQLSIRLNDANRTLRLNSDATVSGDNTGDQTISLTGDVTGSGTGSFAATIANDAVTFGKMQNIATDTLIGRSTSGTGDPEAITCTAAGRALLDDANANAQRETLGLIRRKVSTATTGVSTSYTDVTDLNFSVVSGTTYFINGWVLAECSNTGGGVCLSANGPSFTYYGARYEGTQTGGGSQIRSDITAYDSLGALGDVASVSAANTPYIYIFQAVLVPSANGTFTLRVKRGHVAGNVAVRAGVLEATAM